MESGSGWQRVFYSKDDVIFREGDHSHDLVILESGNVKIYKTTVKDELIPIAVAGPGEFVGELSLFDNCRRSATVQALNDAIVIKIPNENMEKILSKIPEWSRVMIVSMASRLRDLDDLLKKNGVVDESIRSEFDYYS